MIIYVNFQDKISYLTYINMYESYIYCGIVNIYLIWKGNENEDKF
jgi:hypothetical protein